MTSMTSSMLRARLDALEISLGSTHDDDRRDALRLLGAIRKNIANLLPSSPELTDVIPEEPPLMTPMHQENTLSEIAKIACLEASRSIISKEGHSLLVIAIGPTGDFQMRAVSSPDYSLNMNEVIGVLTRAALAYAGKFTESPAAAPEAAPDPEPSA